MLPSLAFPANILCMGANLMDKKGVRSFQFLFLGEAHLWNSHSSPLPTFPYQFVGAPWILRATHSVMCCLCVTWHSSLLFHFSHIVNGDFNNTHYFICSSLASLPLLESMFSACLRLFSYSTLKWYKCLALFPSNIYDILFFTFRSLFHWHVFLHVMLGRNLFLFSTNTTY